MQSYSNFEQLLEAQGEYVTLLHGISMYPMARYMKDPVRLVPVRRELKRYDIAAYACVNKYVVHRVLEVHDRCYVFRGDNCAGKEYVPKDAVVGVVAGYWRFGRYISVDSMSHKLYSRIWVFINPLVRLSHKLSFRSLKRRIGDRQQ